MRAAAVLLILFMCLFGCGKQKQVFFCEGVDENGKEVNAGTVFTAGELSAVYHLSNPSDEDLKFQFIVYIVREKERLKFDIKETVIKAGDTVAVSDLSLYNKGFYDVEVVSGTEVAGTGTLEIRDE